MWSERRLVRRPTVWPTLYDPVLKKVLGRERAKAKTERNNVPDRLTPPHPWKAQTLSQDDRSSWRSQRPRAETRRSQRFRKVDLNDTEKIRPTRTIPGKNLTGTSNKIKNALIYGCSSAIHRNSASWRRLRQTILPKNTMASDQKLGLRYERSKRE